MNQVSENCEDCRMNVDLIDKYVDFNDKCVMLRGEGWNVLGLHGRVLAEGGLPGWLL